MNGKNILLTVFGKFKDDESCLLVETYNFDWKLIAY